MSQHISPVDCAPVSPFMSLSSQLSSMGAQLQDIPSLSQQQPKNAAAVPSAATSLLAAQVRPPPSFLASSQPLRPAAVRVDGSHGSFLSHFHDGVQLELPHVAVQPHGHASEAMVEQLRRMELSKRVAQSDELERIYRQHAPAPLSHNQQWAAEFGAAHPHSLAQPHQQQQLHHRMHQHIVQQTPQWAAEFEAIKQQQQQQQHYTNHQQQQLAMLSMMQHSRPMLPLPSYSPLYAQQRPMLHMPPASLFSQQTATAPLTVSPLTQPTQQQQQPQQAEAVGESATLPSQSSSSLDNNVHAVSDREMVNSFPPSSLVDGEAQQLNQQPTGDGLGGGLNADMIDALLRSDDPKWRQSKFLQFISKIKSGQIEFRDNQAIDRGQSQQQSAAAAAGAQWADEYSSDEQQHSSFPTAWSEDFEQREGMRGLSTADGLSRMAAGWSGELSADAEDEKVWEDEYRRVVQGDGRLDESELDGAEDEKEWAQHFQQHADFDSFSHINWREALEKAKAGAGDATADVEAAAAADPQYQFTSPLQSSHSEANAAFEEGVRLLERGELRAAIAAFETAVRLDPEHSEAWCQLGAAQAENEEESNAIAALLKSVAIDPYNLKALMMLGVSYTNDLEESRALQYLKTW